MRVKEMHPFCCIFKQSPESVEDTASADALQSMSKSLPPGHQLTVAGVLFKWTNYWKGWRPRWFVLRNGVLSYMKIGRLENLHHLTRDDDLRFIGEMKTSQPLGVSSDGRRRMLEKIPGIVNLKVLSVQESKSDQRRFYIITATKTLHLKSGSKSDRVAWIKALASTRSLFPHSNNIFTAPSDSSVSTERLKKRLLEEGINETLVKDCEQIMLSEFLEVQEQLNVLSEQRSSLLDALRQLQAAYVQAEAAGVQDGKCQSFKQEATPSVGCRKCGECLGNKSFDGTEQQESEGMSDGDEGSFYDTKESFSEPTRSYGSLKGASNHVEDDSKERESLHSCVEDMHSEKQFPNFMHPQIQRRSVLPDPVEKERRVSLWYLIKDNVGKDLTRVCLPVYFNEPISTLQRCFEDLEYSYLLDQAYDHGKVGNSLQRILKVAAFAVSGYASSESRHCKPFNPLLGETYEADYPEKGIRFLSEKVSHHPTIIACHCEGRGWKFWGESNLRSKFWGHSIQLDPIGVLTLEFDDGEIFQWSKVTSSIKNIIVGKVYCDHHGMMRISGNRNYSCNLKFKEQTILDRNPRQVHGYVEDVTGKRVATVLGKWDDSLYYVNGDGNGNFKCSNVSYDGSLLWKSSKRCPILTRYNLTSFAITLNELTPGLKEKLPPTDSRLRPDQRHLENGEYEKANAEKLRLERRQRMSRKLQESGWKPRWFQREGEGGGFRYAGGYWEAREDGKWDGCPDIFGEELLDQLEG